MKKVIGLLGIASCALTLAACNNSKGFTKYSAAYVKGTTSGEYNLADDIQDGTILHCWNWSYNSIKDNLEAIAKAGYTAVQTSPVQQCKAYAKSGSWSSEWWKLYQPVAFSIAEDSYLGTKAELQAMCAEAQNYGIKVICDIVVNHLGNDESGKGYSPRIQEFEPTVWSDRSTYFHQNTNQVGDANATSVTQYQLSHLPDLNTGNEYIQERVSALLKECIDCGVDGFRFDAAKHIETPDDGTVASNFWPTVLGAATEYAKTKNQEMFYYGEILNTPGGGRSYDSYTQYMSVTDSSMSHDVLFNMIDGVDKTFLDYLNYNFSTDGTKAVVWAESHDNFADLSTQNCSQQQLNRAYAIQATHGGAAPLYFVRPQTNTGMGEVGSKAWKSSEIKAVNNFHNKFLGKNETVSIQQEKFYVNERGNEGAVIVSTTEVTESKEISLKVGALKSGKYYDQVTGKEFVVSGGKVKGVMGNSGIVVLTKDTPKITPTINNNHENGYFYNTFEVKISAKNAISLSYSIDNGAEIECPNPESNTTITIQTEAAAPAQVVLNVTSESADGGVAEETFTYYKIEKRDGYAAIGGLQNVGSVQYVAWTWSGSGTGKWTRVEIVGDVGYIQTTEKKFLLASFPLDFSFDSYYGTSMDVWSHKLGQTEDIVISAASVPASTI